MSKVIQIVLPDDQRKVVELLIKVTQTKMSTLGRRLLLDWAVRTIDMPGVVRGGRCGVTRGASGVTSLSGTYCAKAPATYYMTTWKVFICEECAKRMDALVAVPATDLHQPALNIDLVRAEIERLAAQQTEITNKTDDELWEEAVQAMAALQARKIGAPSFDALVERFKLDS